MSHGLMRETFLRGSIIHLRPDYKYLLKREY